MSKVGDTTEVSTEPRITGEMFGYRDVSMVIDTRPSSEYYVTNNLRDEEPGYRISPCTLMNVYKLGRQPLTTNSVGSSPLNKHEGN